MTPSKNCIELVKHFEGLFLKAYICPSGLPTIGYGSTYYEDGSKVKLGDKITKERAEKLLTNVLPNYADTVDKYIKVGLLQHQYDALVSFCFNCGSSDTLFKMINDQNPTKEICDWWRTHYITGAGKKLEGLVKRRNAEATLFETGQLKLT